MRMRWWPRSIRWQLLAGLLLLETLSIGLFALVLVRQQRQEVYERAHTRLEYEARSLAEQAGKALEENEPGWVGRSAGNPEMVFAGAETGIHESLAHRFDGDLFDGREGVAAFGNQAAVRCGDKDAGSRIGGNDEVHIEGIAVHSPMAA